jgi:hypothetical protein
MLAATTLVAITGCSTHYVPRHAGLVAMTMRDGKPVYVRDGVSFEHGLLGGGLVDAVAGNPAATVAAREYHDRMSTGLFASLVGIVAMIGGTTFSVGELAQEGDHNHTAGVAALVALGGMVLALTGASYAASAEPYRWDAINIFNDGAPGPLQPAPVLTTPPGWSASAPQQTLRMRD